MAAAAPESVGPENGGKPFLRLLVKTDVAGSEEAICQALASFPQTKVSIDILHSDVGEITPADIELAETCGGMFNFFCVSHPHYRFFGAHMTPVVSLATILCFNLKNTKAMAEAENAGVTVWNYRFGGGI